MNVLFVSPAFPPNVPAFCTSLARHGVKVLGVGDSPRGDLSGELSGALAEYAYVPSLADYDAVYRAAAGLISRHGRLDRIEAQTEMWLETAARLGEDFHVPGTPLETLRRQRRKSGMAELFDQAGIPRIPHLLPSTEQAMLGFVAEHGFPLVFKPDTGAGAARTFTVGDVQELQAALAEPLDDVIVQPFVRGDIVTYDGLCDAHGHVVFALSHRYDTGIMEVVSGGLDGHYYSDRSLPPGLDHLGRRAVAAFDLRNRFFHLELFERPAPTTALPPEAPAPPSYVALEMNLRPPGGFTTDMMNYACDFDVYELWARAIAGESLAGFEYQRRYAVAHAGRRDRNDYALSHGQLRRELAGILVAHRRLPRELAVMQGDEMYLVRHPDVAVVKAAIELVQRKASVPPGPAAPRIVSER